MRLLGIMDDYLVYEVDRGQYIIVDPETKRWTAEWTWYGQLGRWCDRFTKCSVADGEGKALEVIADNAEDILERLNKFAEDEDDDFRNTFLNEQEEFYNELEDGREYDWSDGEYVEEEQ